MYIEDSEPSYEDLSTSSPSPRRPTARSSPGPSQESRPKHSRHSTYMYIENSGSLFEDLSTSGD